MFNKFTPQAFSPEIKPQLAAVKPKSNETSEPVALVDNKTIEKKEEKPITNLFGMKSSTSLTNKSINVPDVLKNSTVKAEAIPIEKPAEKVKENIPVKASENVPPMSQKTEKEDKKDVGSKPSPTIEPPIISSTSPVASSVSESASSMY